MKGTLHGHEEALKSAPHEACQSPGGTGCLFSGWNKGGQRGFETACKALDIDLDSAFSGKVSLNCLCSRWRLTELK